MVISKEYIGKYENTNGSTQYYMINNNCYYGIELVEEQNAKIVSTSEWVSESRESTLALVKLLCLHGASSIHLSEIIDNYVE